MSGHRDGTGFCLRERKHFSSDFLCLRFRDDHRSTILNIISLSVNYIDASKPGWHRPMRDRGDLHRLALAAIEGATQKILLLAADAVAGIPKVYCVALVSHVTKHAAELAILDFIKHLPA